MSKNLTISLAISTMANITKAIGKTLGDETRKSLLFSSKVYNDFLQSRQPTIDFAPLTSISVSQRRTEESRDKDVELARFIEREAQKIGFKSEGIKLLPEKTGVVIDFTFAKQKEREKVYARRQR